MKIEITDRVSKYIKKNDIIGICLKRETLAFGWAGCRDVIQGEFIKHISDMEKREIEYINKEVNGIKVFIPIYLKNLKYIKISCNFISVFTSGMVLDVEGYEKI